MTPRLTFPVPWRFEPERNGRGAIVCADGREVLELEDDAGQDDVENAQFICEAVNMHAARIEGIEREATLPFHVIQESEPKGAA